MAEQPLSGVTTNRTLKPYPFGWSNNVDVSFPVEREPNQALWFVISQTCHPLAS